MPQSLAKIYGHLIYTPPSFLIRHSGFVISLYPPAVICTTSITSPSFTLAESISLGSSAI
jgi:hypothetical protein